MVRVAIVGCGKIADQHVQAVSRIEGSKVVAVCDRETLMAQQLAERFSIEGCFSDVAALLREAAPDVVHVTTPPQSHHALGLQCLAAGAHVYLEKPFTVNAAEAAALIEMAGVSERKITAGHNYQFTPEMLRMRRKVEAGFLGGRAVHLESQWSYDLGDASYVGPLLGNPDHWVRRLPGQLMHNIVSHGIARLTEFLSDDLVELVAIAHQSEQLRGLGGGDILDELRVMIRDANGTTAYFSFSTQIKPGMNRFRVYGPRNSITVDLGSGSTIEDRGKSYKSYLTFLGPPFDYARQYFGNGWRNAVDILRWRLHQDSGMKEL
ncbi:MAG TPA: Gfo/Idh/MocA family oxidoreductase, partial [Vicinamibacterales bacterium]|nr:Gfo/Idh/MocA family oxidoreductase [Vicinamibacterales bacterium]